MTPDELRAEAARLTAHATELENTQLNRADLKTMSTDEIVDAKASGRLDSLLGITKEN